MRVSIKYLKTAIFFTFKFNEKAKLATKNMALRAGSYKMILLEGRMGI